MSKYLTSTVTLLLFSLTCAIAQEQNTKREPAYLLKDPSVVTLELLRPNTTEVENGLSGSSRSYMLGSKIYFRLLARNSSFQPILIPIVLDYVQMRPQLTRDGDAISYKKGLEERLKDLEDLLSHAKVQVIKLQPNEQRVIDYVYLDRWYDPARPGHYHLSVKHQFEPGQVSVESPSITFEVITPKRNTERN
jgi:hypothetical protein